MNQHFYEHQAREKLGQLRAEGQLSQAVNRSKHASPATPRSLPRIIAVAVSVLAAILLWAR